MFDNSELPIGFTMELSKHLEILNQFANLPAREQDKVIEGARNVESREEMRNYVTSMFK